MSTEKLGWHHCGRCGSFFRGAGDCSECGSIPVVDDSEIAFRQAGKRSPSEKSPPPEVGVPRKRTHKKRRKKGMVVFVLGWFLFLGLVALLVKKSRERGADAFIAQQTVTEAASEQREFQDAYNKCNQLVLQFLSNSTPEVRVNFVHDPAETLGKMVSFSGDGLIATDGEEFAWQSMQFLETPEGKYFAGVGTLGGERRLELVFLRNDEDDWSIDWPGLVRYSTQPFPLFLSGGGSDVGDFRVYARRHAGSSGEQGDTSGIVLLDPRPWDSSKTGVRSPEIVVDPESEDGRIIVAAFKDMDDGRAPFDTKLHKDDPYVMIRLHVRLRRAEDDPKRIELVKVHACHWMSIDHPGVAVAPQE